MHIACYNLYDYIIHIKIQGQTFLAGHEISKFLLIR